MVSKLIKNLISLVAVTTLALPLQAEQPRKASQFETLTTLPIELKYLPLIFDLSKLKMISKKKAPLENLDINSLPDPGAEAGHSMCALNIAAATLFIAENVSLIPFKQANDKNVFLKRISNTRIYAGENLEQNNHKMMAITYPQHNAIVLSSLACKKLGSEGASGYSLLLNQLLAISHFPNHNQHLSRTFAQRIRKLASTESVCKTDGCIMRKISQNNAVKKWISSNENCENGASWLQSFRKISTTKYEVICGDTSERLLYILETRPLPESFNLKHTVKILKQQWLNKKVVMK